MFLSFARGKSGIGNVGSATQPLILSHYSWKPLQLQHAHFLFSSVHDARRWGQTQEGGLKFLTLHFQLETCDPLPFPFLQFIKREEEAKRKKEEEEKKAKEAPKKAGAWGGLPGRR